MLGLFSFALGFRFSPASLWSGQPQILGVQRLGLMKGILEVLHHQNGEQRH